MVSYDVASNIWQALAAGCGAISIGNGSATVELGFAPDVAEAAAAGAYTRPLFSSTKAVLVTPPRVPLSNRLGENHAPNVSHKMCLR